MVYDITNYGSFENLEDWIKCVKKFTSDQEKAPHFALVANKTDMEHLRAVKADRHCKMAETYAMSSHFVSAKSGDSVNLMFQRVAAEIMGFQLSSKELEQHVEVVKAAVPESEPVGLRAPKTMPETMKRSNVCSVQ